MDNESVKKFRVKKTLKISLISLLTLFFLLLIFGFVRILPKDIEYTNVTSNSFTVSWSTKFPTKGVVSVVEGKNRLPVSFTMLGKDLGFDTRDIKFTEILATEKANEKIWESDSQSINIGDIVTEKVVAEKGSYYTHHIEVRGVNPESEYRVMVGDGLLFLNSGLFKEEAVLKTLEVANGIDTPVPTYGLIKDANGEDLPIEELLPVTDGVVYFNYFEELSGERSNTYSSSLNEDGAWYMDISTAVDSEGELFFEKYSQEISNIYGELYIDLGPLGKWEKRINMNEASPAETIVINMAGYVEDVDNPDMLIKVDGSSAIKSEVIKGVSASSCQFVAYCGGCVEGGKECACDPAVLERRGCGAGNSLEKGIQELKDATTTSCTGGSPGSSVKYGTQCKVCSPVYDNKGEIKYYQWENAKEDICVDDKYKGGSTQGPTDASCKEIYGSEYFEENGECTKVTTPPTTTSDTDLQRMTVGTTCYVKGDARTVQRVGGENRCLVSSATDTTTADGEKSIINATSNLQKCINPDGCICTYIQRGDTITKEISKDGTCVLPSWDGSLNQDVSQEGKPCKDPEKNIANGVLNSEGKCKNREGEKLLKNEDILGKPCFEKGTVLYATSSSNNMYQCVNNEFKFYSANISCNEGSSCRGWFHTVNQCINSQGELLDCSSTGKGSFEWRKEKGASSRGAFILDEDILKPGEKCEGKICLCGSKYLSSEEPFCPEVTTCMKSTYHPYGYTLEPINENKICATDGSRCDNKGYCNKEKTVSYLKPNPFNINKTYAQENLPSEYMIDTTTGKVLGIEPGIYTLKDNDETYVFTIKTQDVKDGKGDMIIYIDSNENGMQDDGERTLSDFSSSVKINAVKKLYTYNLKEGFNFISLPFLVNDEIARTAAGLLKLINAEYHDSVYSIAKYNGTWKVVGQNVQQYDNNDFQLIPGEGYIVKTNKEISIQIAGRPIDFESTTDNAPITFYPGWNLIGVYGSNAQPYTAKSLIQSINRYEPVDFTADNVSRWESDMQRYDGLQLTNENGIELEYGFDFPINTLQSYFVRVLQGKGNWQPDLR